LALARWPSPHAGAPCIQHRRANTNDLSIGDGIALFHADPCDQAQEAWADFDALAIDDVAADSKDSLLASRGGGIETSRR